MWDVTFEWTAPLKQPTPRQLMLIKDGPDGPALSFAPSLLVGYYNPLTSHPCLYRKYTDIQTTTLTGPLDFAEEHGLLFHRDQSRFADTGTEPVGAWLPRIIWMKHLVDLWDQARPDHGNAFLANMGLGSAEAAEYLREYGLHTLVRWGKRGAEVREPDVGDGPFVPEAWRGRTWWKSGIDRADGEPHARPARAYVAARLNEELSLPPAPSLSFALRFGAEMRPAALIAPANLWQAMVWQFARAIVEGTRYRRCALCRTWVVEKPEMGDSSRTACSASCRQQLYRQRQVEARALKAKGLGLKAIAAQVGSDVETVKGWLGLKRGSK